jgi:hypothetical protein
MYVNEIDDLFDGILNKLNNFLVKEKIFEKLSSDTNFVKFQNDILSTIKKFIEIIPKKDILDTIKNDSYYEPILNIIKRYSAFYIYLGIAYHYNGGRELYITNIIEASRFQKDATYQIINFFNSENNSKIITFYNDIKNFVHLLQFKTIDKIKILLLNNTIKFESTIKLFNDLGEDYVSEYFIDSKDNFHNIIKSLIFKQIYLKEEKNEIINMLNQLEKQNAEYKYIEIVVSNEKKIVDFNVIQKFLNIEQLKSGLAEEIYNYLEDTKNTKEIIIKQNLDFVNYLFDNQIIIPITEDFLRYHKNIEKYDSESLVNSSNIKERDATKIKYIISKMNNVRNYYSPLLNKNPKQKLETAKLFYKPLDPKMATLYNDNEEIKIIQKLQLSESASDYDLLVDLENIRKYSYVNFKNLSKDGIKIHPSKTIQGIRYTNINYKGNETKTPIEVRIGHSNIDMNVIGIGWNSSKLPLECFKAFDLIDVRKNLKEENGYNAFVKIMGKTFEKPDKKLYYWLFDNSKDKPKIELYVNYNINDAPRNIKIMIEEIYKNYIRLVYNKINTYIQKADKFSMWSFNNIIKEYSKKYIDFNLYPEMKNELIEKVILDKIQELPIEPDDVDSIIPGRRDKLIKLPVLEFKNNVKNIIELDAYEIDVTLEMANRNLPICLHYIKWKNIMRISKNSDDFNQAVFDFVKQYIKLNKRSDYICKSCGEQVQIQKFVVEGTYVEELDTFLTTSMTVSQNLEELPKYSKYIRTIRNIEKNIEKFAYSIGTSVYIGNTPVIKLRRKMVIKDVIDLILIHTDWLKKQPKDRIEQSSKKYGIDKNLTTLFFFELKDEIFLTNSQETDYYKLIKYNNIMAYLILIIISEMNSGQILSLNEDKRYNYFLFQKIGQNLFGNLFLRKNEKEKIAISQIPLLAYILYYISGIMISNRLWLYNESNVDIKDKPILLINLQKTIINTVVDLLNSLVEANFEPTKNFLYEIINVRISIKLLHTFNDDQLLKRIESNSMKNIMFNETTKKITFLTKKVGLVNLDLDFNIMEKMNETCDINTFELDKLSFQSDSNDLDLLTNCPDGKLHVWEFKSGDLNCNLCKKSYNELTKMIETTSTEKSSNEYLNKIKLINLKKLSKKYCISGNTHKVDNSGKCIKCEVNVNTWEPSDKDLKQFEKNLEMNTNEISIEQINQMKKYNENLKLEEQTNKNIINELLKMYETKTNNNIEKYIDEFVNRLIKILGPKIKIQDKIIYLKETIFIIDHDYFGNLIKEPIYILSSDDKIYLNNKHPSFNKDVLYYKDESNKVYVYYDSITYQYLGYSEDNKNIKRIRNNISLKIELSIKDCIMYLGYENQYYNIYHVNKDYQQNLPSNLGVDTKGVCIQIIRNRMNNLKQIITRIQSIIHNIRNSGGISSIYNIDERKIVNEFTKKLKKFNIKDENGSNNIFKYSNIIMHKLHTSYNIPDNLNIELNNNYLHVNNINSLSNSDSKLIFYIIFNFNRLLDYNKQPVIESELSYMIINIIRYLFNLYYRSYSNYHVRRFDFLLINETPYIDETLKIIGHYQELLTQQEIDDPEKKDNVYTLGEELDSLDIDEYEQDDDVDGTAEALDGYE